MLIEVSALIILIIIYYSNSLLVQLEDSVFLELAEYLESQ